MNKKIPCSECNKSLGKFNKTGICPSCRMRINNPMKKREISTKVANKLKKRFKDNPELHPNWKGFHIFKGYILIKNKNHPHARSDGYVLEHRIVMEKEIGRYLKPTEIVHHINGNKSDNRIKNLVIVNIHEHEHNTLLKIAQRRIRELENEKNL